MKNEKPIPKRGPVWGFHEPTVEAGAGVEQGIRGAGAAMQDPRFGMASGLGGAIGMANLYGGSQFIGPQMKRYYSTGGFQQAVAPMKKRLGFGPHTEESVVRSAHMDKVEELNTAATFLREESDPIKKEAGWAAFNALSTKEKDRLRNTIRGQQELRSERLRQSYTPPGMDNHNN